MRRFCLVTECKIQNANEKVGYLNLVHAHNDVFCRTSLACTILLFTSTMSHPTSSNCWKSETNVLMLRCIAAAPTPSVVAVGNPIVKVIMTLGHVWSQLKVPIKTLSCWGKASAYERFEFKNSLHELFHAPKTHMRCTKLLKIGRQRPNSSRRQWSSF